MNWFFLSVACAFFTATAAALTKILLKKRNEIFVLWIIYAFSLPLFLIVLIRHPIPRLTLSFWKTVAILLPLEMAAFLLYLRALKFSPLSLVFPFLGLTPVFTIFTSSTILGELLSISGIAGVILVSVGAYILNANAIKEGFWVPIKSIYRERGSMLMILVAFIYSFTSVFGKRAVLLSSPKSFPGIYYSIFFLILTPLAYLNIKRSHLDEDSRRKIGGVAKFRFDGKDIFLFLGLGVIFATAIMLHFHAISLVNVSYMISVKRLSLVISVLYGALIFKEKNIGYRMLGSSIMLCGVLILSLVR